MQSFRQYLIEDREITWDELKSVQNWINKMWSVLHMDIEFTHHFFDRVNDARNKVQITVKELVSLLQKEFQKFGEKLKFMKPGMEVLLRSAESNINIPVAFHWDASRKMLDVVAKTVMRKKNFLTRTKTLTV